MKAVEKFTYRIILLFLLIAGLVVAIKALADETFRGLPIEPENRCSPYDKKAQYPYPQSIELEIIARDGLYGPYTGRHFTSRRQTDIEHITPTAEAHDSGLCSANPETRRRFATDLDNLTLASPHVNRHEKSGKDAGEWMPDRNRCWFADRVVRVKRKYGLSVDRREAEALDRVLAGCQSTSIIVYPASEAP